PRPRLTTPAPRASERRQWRCMHRPARPTLLCSEPPVSTEPSSGSDHVDRDLLRLLEVLEEHRLGLTAERPVFDDCVKLEVDGNAERVVVGRANASPSAIHDARLRVHHLAAPLPD